MHMEGLHMLERFMEHGEGMVAVGYGTPRQAKPSHVLIRVPACNGGRYLVAMGNVACLGRVLSNKGPCHPWHLPHSCERPPFPVSGGHETSVDSSPCVSDKVNGTHLLKGSILSSASLPSLFSPQYPLLSLRHNPSSV